MPERYSRAAALSAPKAAARKPRGAVDGYWLDGQRFFFIAERYEAALDRIVPVPSLADCRTGKVSEIVPMATLSRLLGDAVQAPLEPEALWSADMPDGDTLAFSWCGTDFRLALGLDLPNQRLSAAGPSLQAPALYSPDRRYACTVKGHDLWLLERATGVERPLTTDGAPHQCYGQCSETGLAAVAYRRNPSPLGLWSADSQWFLTQRIDERDLPELALLQHSPPGGGRPVLHRYKYPIPGDPLPVAVMVAIHVDSGRVLTFDQWSMPWLMLSPFFARTAWFGNKDTAWFIRFDRFCRQAELIQLDLQRGLGRRVIGESAATGYIEVGSLMGRTPNVRTLAASDEVIWFSERDGWGHLYLYDALSGELKNQITRGAWRVRDIVHVDEQRRRVLFLAGGLDPRRDRAQRSLCAADLDGGGWELLRSHDGDLFVPRTEPGGFEQDRPWRPTNAPSGVSGDGRQVVVQYLSVAEGDRTELLDLHTSGGLTIARSPPAADAPSRRFEALAADGITPLHGVMFVPWDFDASRRYPLVVYIYPGPHVAHQPQSAHTTDAAQARALAQLGFVTLMLDTRGMPLGSRAFNQAGYGSLLEPQLADHAAVVRQLRDRHAFIDADRIGMLGYSGGGYATARALCDYGELFQTGVAVCGNYDPALYTAAWQEKYCGPGHHREQSVRAVAHRLHAKLLLITGDMDENVHPAHTLSLADALIDANRDFDLLVVPNAGHSLLMTHGYVLRRVWDYLVRHLLEETPPPQFELHFQAHELAAYARNGLQEIRR